MNAPVWGGRFDLARCRVP